MFFGYGNCEKGYMFNVNTQNIIILRDVVFDEKANWSWENNTEVKISVSLDGDSSNNMDSGRT